MRESNKRFERMQKMMHQATKEQEETMLEMQ
jgi:hypothetical protein